LVWCILEKDFSVIGIDDIAIDLLHVDYLLIFGLDVFETIIVITGNSPLDRRFSRVPGKHAAAPEPLVNLGLRTCLCFAEINSLVEGRGNGQRSLLNRVRVHAAVEFSRNDALAGIDEALKRPWFTFLSLITRLKQNFLTIVGLVRALINVIEIVYSVAGQQYSGVLAAVS
jgi:hypothetical protein